MSVQSSPPSGSDDSLPLPGVLRTHRPGAETGQLLGARYMLGDQLGAGGFSAVYAAVDRITGAEVAVKLLSHRESKKPKVRQRFAQEAQLGASLNHPNLVRIFDLGHHGDRPFLVMERLRGHTLYELIMDRVAPLPWRDVCDLILQLARGIRALHAVGAIHRDIKPANCMLVRDDDDRLIIKLIDFGLAKLTSRFTLLTTPGNALGTRAYMSPEAFRGDPVDARADIYSLGCTFYQALTHKAPFYGGTFEQIKRMHLEDTPAPPSARHPGAGIPASIDQVVLRALAKTPEDRHASIDDFIAALASAARTVIPPPAAPPPSPFPRLAAPGSLLCALAVGVLLGHQLAAAPPAPSPLALARPIADIAVSPYPTRLTAPLSQTTTPQTTPNPLAPAAAAGPRLHADLVSRRIAALTPTLRALASAPSGSHYATFVVVDGRARLTHWDARQVDPRDPWARDLERAVARLRLPSAAQPLTVTVELEL